jgi:hypothetical protein
MDRIDNIIATKSQPEENEEYASECVCVCVWDTGQRLTKCNSDEFCFFPLNVSEMWRYLNSTGVSLKGS